jgi:TPR repeat protein
MAGALAVLAVGSVVLYFSRVREDSVKGTVAGGVGGASVSGAVVQPESKSGGGAGGTAGVGRAEEPSEMSTKPIAATASKDSVQKVAGRVVVPDRDDVVRDAGAAKDHANVYWKSKFTLFDLHTDEPIFPEMVDGTPIYRVFYCSAESRVPGYTELSTDQLERFLFYKFRNLKNCQDWIAGKEPEVLGAASGAPDEGSGKSETTWLRLAGTEEGTTFAKEELMSIVSGFWVRRRPELIAELRKRADAGDGAAMGELAYRYRSGIGVPVDMEQAHRFAKRGAELGNPLAAWSYGVALRGVFGVKKDLALALRYTSEAANGLKEMAEAGNRFAKNALANVYLEGAGVERDEEKAYAMFHELAEAGDANAMNTLSIRSTGSKPGYPKNTPLKIYWSVRAIEAGSLDALINLSTWHRVGDGVPRDMRFVFLCWCKSAEAGDVRIMHDLAMMYVEGTVVPVDMGMANYWLEQATLRGCSRSMVTFGTHLQGGWGMKPDAEAGARYIRQGADAGEMVGILNMGKITQTGIGVPVDQKAAFEWFLKAANAGSPHGYRELARCYREGLGTEVSAEKAMQMLERATQLPAVR